MDYLDNDYLIPVILSDDKATTKIARTIRSITKIRPFIFSHHLSLFQKVEFKCTELPKSNAIALEHLCNFASKMSTKGSLLLIYGEDYRGFIQEYSHELESRYIAISFEQATRRAN